MNKQYSLTWLPFLPEATPVDYTTPAKTAQAELAAGLATLTNAPDVTLTVDADMEDGCEIG